MYVHMLTILMELTSLRNYLHMKTRKLSNLHAFKVASQSI